MRTALPVAAVAAFVLSGLPAGGTDLRPPAERFPPPLPPPAAMSFAPAHQPPVRAAPSLLSSIEPAAEQSGSVAVSRGLRVGAVIEEAEEGRRDRPRARLGVDLDLGSWKADMKLSGKPGFELTLNRPF